ncbi:MAG TPA: hypothetical protein EYP82_07735 [Hydrogenothermaceae bacterium]|nr:hypothetical protein [Hydrogenothermaceae bacterium]
MAKKFILISFLGNAEYEDSYYIFDNSMDFLPIKDKKNKSKMFLSSYKRKFRYRKNNFIFDR